jgi:hypothetical protein
MNSYRPSQHALLNDLPTSSPHPCPGGYPNSISSNRLKLKITQSTPLAIRPLSPPSGSCELHAIFAMATPCTLISAAPAEVTVRIFQCCSSFADLRALLLTCRHLHSVWVANAPSIVWHVGPKVIPAFDQALMAVRNAFTAAPFLSRHPTDGVL